MIGSGAVILALVVSGQFIVPRVTVAVSAPATNVCSTGTVRLVKTAASGAGTGLTWTDAMAMPASPTRGTTYCVADGSYGSKVWSTANSGSSVITIRKATVADHGSATGWSDTLGDGQAIWSDWQIPTDFWVFDGVSRNSDWYLGTTSTYGFKVTGQVRLDIATGVGMDDSTIRYTDIVGPGRDSCGGDDNVYGLYGNSRDTFQYDAIRDNDRTMFLMRDSWDDFTLEYTYLARNTSRPTQGGGHGEMISMTSGNRWILRYNVVEDTEGTGGLFASLNNGALADVKVYGNTIRHTANYNVGRLLCNGEAHDFGWSALIYVAWDASQHNSISGLKFYNNTIIQNSGGASGIHIDIGGDLGGTAVQNNIWWDSVHTDNSFSGGTINSNWYYSTTADNDGTSTVCTVSCTIFVDQTNGDLHLTGPLASAGVTLASPYTEDRDGITRGADGTWDRGALEYH